MGNQHDQHKNENNQKPDDMNRQNQQGGAGNQQGGTGGGQQFDKDRKQQGGQQGRQIDDNQDDLGRDVNSPDKAGNDINKQM